MKANALARLARCLEIRKWLPRAVIVLGLALGPVACTTSNRGSAEPTHSEHEGYASLELDDGKKWVVAKPMMVHIRNLEGSVRDFETAPGRDHAVLALEIQENLGRLVTNCTMEGKAHDELHKWLMPFLALSADYTKAVDPQVQQLKLQGIRQALLVFNEYFE